VRYSDRCSKCHKLVGWTGHGWIDEDTGERFCSAGGRHEVA
jgi:hypothetical protein